MLCHTREKQSTTDWPPNPIPKKLKYLKTRFLALPIASLVINTLHAATVAWNSGTSEWTYTDRVTGGSFSGSGWLAGLADGGSGAGHTTSLYIDSNSNTTWWFGQNNESGYSDFYLSLPSTFEVVGATLSTTRTIANLGGGIFHFSNDYTLDASVLALNGTALNHTFSVTSGRVVSASANAVPDAGSTALLLMSVGLLGFAASKRKQRRH